MHTDADHLYCDCGFKAKYDVYGELTDAEGQKYNLTGLDQMQRQILEEKMQSATENVALFNDQVTVYEIDKEHNLTGTRQETLAAYVDKIQIGEKEIPFSDVQGLAIVSRNNMILHVKGIDGHLEIKSDISFSALKYLYLYEMKGRVQ